MKQELLEKLDESAYTMNSLKKDEIDEKIESLFPRFSKSAVKIFPGVYFYENTKVQVIEKANSLAFLIDGQESLRLLEKISNRHEKNSLSLEDISNHIEAYNASSMLHNRGNSRESKLRVLAKQW
jgi:hypothetical protein